MHEGGESRVIWAPRRNKAQGLLVSALYERGEGTPAERQAVLAGGLPGADKAAALAEERVDPSRYLMISIDAVLLAMAARGLIPTVEGLSPLEAADLAHAEAQFLGKRLALRALADGRNTLFDISMASRPSVESWLAALHRSGYTVTGVFAEIAVQDHLLPADDAGEAGQLGQ
jgi:Zeta toxin